MAKLARITGSLFLVHWLLLTGATPPVAAAEDFDLDCGQGRVVTGISGAVIDTLDLDCHAVPYGRRDRG